MSELLNKFKNIKVENTSRIDEEDESFCKKFDTIYNETLQCYKNTLDSLVLLYNKQIVTVNNSYDLDISMYGSDFSISKVIDSILKLKRSFINNICHYFSNKYQVTIDNVIIYEKHKDIELPYGNQTNKDKTLSLNMITYFHTDYNIILDEIFIQLGGYSFLEKAVDEIKQKAKMPLHYYSYRKYWNYEVKGRIIKFKVNIKDIYPALYYYDSNETKLIDCFTYNKIDDFKSYENGNTDIKFLNSAYALEFATKYLGIYRND
jgi:hypothetical protein